METSTFANLNSNYNDFYVSSSQPGFFRSGSLNQGLGTNYATRALWTSATAKDANSAEQLPTFVSTLSNLHLTAKISGISGTPLPSVTSDFDCQARSTVLPDVGADEFSVISIATGLWETPATWNVNRAPVIGDLVIIDTPHTITLNGTGNAKNILHKGALILNTISALLRLGF